MAQQVHFQRGARGEVAMPALAGERDVLAPVPKNPGFPESGAGGDDRHVARRLGRARVEHGEVARTQLADTVGIGHEVVDEEGGLETEAPGQGVGVDFPREIDQADATSAHRAGQSEAREIDRIALGLEELGNELVKTGGRLAGIFRGA